MSYALYLHIPFCKVRCTYCAFNTYTDQEHLIEAYVQALIQEIRGVGQQLPVRTIYFGGGTPSLLTPKQVEQIVQVVHDEFVVDSRLEITLEANPGTVDFEKLHALRLIGVNRLSMGMQSAHANELAMFGRLHEHGAVVQAVEDGRKAGFDNINLDLIYGVPQQTRAMWRGSLQTALALAPDHLSLYGLSLEAGTEMTRQVKYGELPAPDADIAADMYDDASERMDAAGLVQYEISNWARGDKACQHNLQYWRNLPYLGLGAGAHGYANRTRTVNAMRPQNYIESFSYPIEPKPFPQTPATIKAEWIDYDTEMAETIFLGLRLLEEGLSLSVFEDRFGETIETRFGDEISRLIAKDLLMRDGDSLKLTRQARLISNYVFQHFVAEG